MATDEEILQLRQRVASVLNQQACLDIRFQVDDITIQRHMYAFVGQLVTDDRVHVNIGSNHYNPENNTIYLRSTNVESYEIVHEATHAVIDATNPGKYTTIGTQECLAYIAETVYSIYAGRELQGYDVPSLPRYIWPVARKIKAFNDTHPNSRYVCTSSEINDIKAVLQHSPMAHDYSKGTTMDGVGSGPRRGLIGRIMLESKGVR